ncbi:hypothetical protein E2C01_006036 [Portunus trituberculatus]|uniref:Uncharacterized protein n=1 Tax=Portunus trituberculatus TaxID=210409 RepID=A0A5B7CW09_PORTR|nr:hypothetical protein [Portunus trituberculatus]
MLLILSPHHLPPPLLESHKLPPEQKVNGIRVQPPSPTVGHPVTTSEQQPGPHHKPGGVTLAEHTSQGIRGPWRCTTPPRDGSREYHGYSQKRNALNSDRLRCKHNCHDAYSNKCVHNKSDRQVTG